jgi:hypothetical protein
LSVLYAGLNPRFVSLKLAQIQSLSYAPLCPQESAIPALICELFAHFQSDDLWWLHVVMLNHCTPFLSLLSCIIAPPLKYTFMDCTPS